MNQFPQRFWFAFSSPSTSGKIFNINAMVVHLQLGFSNVVMCLVIHCILIFISRKAMYECNVIKAINQETNA